MKKLLIILVPFIAFSQTNRIKPERIDTLIPKGYYLEKYYPNPFSPVTWTRFGIADSCIVKMFIRDSSNQINIDTIYLGNLDPGNYRYEFGRFVINSNRYADFKGNLYLEAVDNKAKSVTTFISSTKFIWFKY